MRLLLAEDEKSLSRAVTVLLRKSNYEVDSVYDGEEALAYLSSGNYDGAILDIMMPKVDGIQVLRQLPHGFGAGHGLEGHPPKEELAQGRRHSRRQGRRRKQGIRVFLTDSAQPFRRGRRDGAGKAKVHCGAQGVDVCPGALPPRLVLLQGGKPGL